MRGQTALGRRDMPHMKLPNPIEGERLITTATVIDIGTVIPSTTTVVSTAATANASVPVTDHVTPCSQTNKINAANCGNTHAPLFILIIVIIITNAFQLLMS